MNYDEEKLLATVLDLFADRFGKKAILRGGMVLKVMGSARYTNDLDYVFVPYKSKKDIVNELLQCLQELPGAKVEHSLNSKCLRIILTVDGTSIQIEAKVAKEAKTIAIANTLLATQFQLPKRLLHVTDHSVSMSNKMAAWNERRLIRDIYDIWFFLRMGIEPDKEILLERLNKPSYSRLVKTEQYFSGNTVCEFYDFIRKEVNLLTDEEVKSQLADYLPPEELSGLSMLFKVSFVKL